MKKIYLFSILVLLQVYLSAAHVLHISEFGAYPDDEKCDMDAINEALLFAKKNDHSKIILEAGTYNLRRTCMVPSRGYENYLTLYKINNLTIEGAVSEDGRPATRLERNLKLNNETKPPHQVDIAYSKNITLKNLILSNDPPLGTTARVIEVETESDLVKVEILDGLPAYDGMRCASAQAWDLEAGTLKRFGSTPSEATLTIGLSIKDYWEKISDREGRHYQLKGAGFAEKVEVGDGISWHHKSTDSLNQVQIMRSENIVLDNIWMPNVSNAGILAGYNHNITLRKVRFEPENGNLAVGGRDGIHLSNTSGRILVEDCYFKGLRMDPLVFRKTFGVIQEISGDKSIISKPGFTVPVGDRIRFWVGKEPQDRTIASRKVLGKGLYEYRFTKAIPEETMLNSVIGFQSYTIDSGIVRNCIFEGNFGSAIVNFEENIIVEDCIFRDNSYQIKYGANHVSGAFARNNIFRNNVCEDTSWIDIARRGQPSTLVIHSLSRFFKDPQYNQHIEITGNVFKNPHGMKKAVAIHVLNATDVSIHDNVFEGFNQTVLIDQATTTNVHVDTNL